MDEKKASVLAEEETAAQLGESEVDDVIQTISKVRVDNFLRESQSKMDFCSEETKSATQISVVLSEIKADFPEIFSNRSQASVDENLGLLNQLISQSRKLEPEKDWTEDLPFFLSKIKNDDTVN